MTNDSVRWAGTSCLTKWLLGLSLCLSLVCVNATGLNPSEIKKRLDVLVDAYPSQIQSHDGQNLLFKDGTRLPVSEGAAKKTFAEKLRHGSLLDQLSADYPRDAMSSKPAVDGDPGRVRNEAFFVKIYGDCRKGEVEGKLQRIVWLPSTYGKTIQITSVNGVADKLQKVSSDLDNLPLTIKKFLHPIAGTFNCRTVADTGALSMHAYGAAIDISISKADYWLWTSGAHKKGMIEYRNRIPVQIVEIFERHGFIWGGKWYHYDTMHFEYRPELLSR